MTTNVNLGSINNLPQSVLINIFRNKNLDKNTIALVCNQWNEAVQQLQTSPQTPIRWMWIENKPFKRIDPFPTYKQHVELAKQEEELPTLNDVILSILTQYNNTNTQNFNTNIGRGLYVTSTDDSIMNHVGVVAARKSFDQ